MEVAEVENIFHSLNDNQDKAYQELIDQVNATYSKGGILPFKNMRGIKNYFESVTIDTQDFILTGFKPLTLNREIEKPNEKETQEPSIHTSPE